MRFESRSDLSASISPAAIEALNWVRGLAALVVLIGHVRGMFFVGRVRQSSPLCHAAYFATNFAHQAVVVFFVLSGLLVGTSVVESSRAGEWSFGRYASRRLTRLYVVLVPALALTFAWDTLGIHLFGTNGVYGGRPPAKFFGVPDVPPTLTPQSLLGTLAFVQGIYMQPFGANDPLWTLAFEFWSYALFPLLFRAKAGTERRWVRALFAAIAAAILAAGGRLLWSCYAQWSFGAALAILWASARTAFPAWRGRDGLAAMVFTGCVLVSRCRVFHERTVEDLVLAAGTALFFGAVLARGEALRATEHDAARSSPEPVGRIAGRLERSSTWGARLAGFAFTLYVAQYPILIFLNAWLVGRRRWEPDLRHAAFAFLIGACVTMYAFVLSRFTEARTASVRRWFERRMPGLAGRTAS